MKFNWHRGVRTIAADGETSRTDLSDLVDAQMKVLGYGSRTLAAACVDPKAPERGPLWTRGTLDHLRQGQRIKAPDLPQLRALAAGLGMPLGAVQEAAGSQFFGIDTVWSDDHGVRALIHGYRDMSPEDQEKVQSLIEANRRLKRG